MLVLLLLLLTRQLTCLCCSLTQVGWSKWHRKVFYGVVPKEGIDPMRSFHMFAWLKLLSQILCVMKWDFTVNRVWTLIWSNQSKVLWWLSPKVQGVGISSFLDDLEAQFCEKKLLNRLQMVWENDEWKAGMLLSRQQPGQNQVLEPLTCQYL